MRIGVDGHVLTGKFQGTRTTLSALLRALAPRLGKHQMVVYSNDPQEAREMLGPGVFEHKDLYNTSSIPRLLLQFPRLFKRDRIDLGVFQYIAPLWGRHLIFIHDLLPITHPHLFPAKVRWRTRIFFALSIWRASLVICVSEHTRREIVRLFNLPSHRLATVRNGPSFEVDTYFAKPEAKNERYVLTVGRIEPRKNITLLAKAFRRSRLEGVKLVIVGSFDPEFKRDDILGEGVEIISGLGDEELIKLYREASLFVYPSAAEGFGIPLLDALLFGLPVISSNQTSLPEVGGDLATYFDPTAPEAVEQLAGLIRDHFGKKPIPSPTLAQRRAHAREFSWETAADSFMDLATAFDSTLQEQRRERG